MSDIPIRIAVVAQATQALRTLKGLSGAVKAGAAAAGAATGAALAAGVSQALEQGNLSAKLGTQLGLTKDEAGRVGKLAGRVYADNFGKDVGQVNDAIKGVYQNIGRGNEQWTKKITEQVLTVADVFEQDLGGTTAAVGQLLRTGLAKDAEEALDVITVGLQSGADKAGDLFDTFTEYGTQFRKFGLDAKAATGLLSQGLKAGARDADVVADALKEFSILALDGNKKTQAAFEAVGLSAKKVTDDIAAGGPRAAGALDAVLDGLRAVEDPATRSQLAVALFGTKAEDLGDALYALDLSSAAASLGEVAGAAGRAVDAMGDTPAAKIEAFKRKLSQGLVVAIGDVIGKFDALVQSIPSTYWTRLSGSLDGVSQSGAGARDALAGLAAAVTGQSDGYGAFLQTLRVLQAGVDSAALVVGNLTFQLHTATAAVYAAKAGWLFLTGDVDGARDAVDRAKQSTNQATAALEGQRRGVDTLRQNWRTSGAEIKAQQDGIAQKAAIAAKSVGDQHDRGAKLAMGSYSTAAGSISGSQARMSQSGIASAGALSRSHASAARETSGSWSHVPGAIQGYFARTTLVGAGVSVMSSFLSGARSVWSNQIAPWLSARAAEIKNLKGPPAKDRVLLTDAGRLVMRGFRAGLEDGFRDTRTLLSGFTRTLPDSVSAGAFDLQARGGVIAQGVAPSAPISIEQVIVQGTFDLRSPEERRALAAAAVREIQAELVAYEGSRR